MIFLGISPQATRNHRAIIGLIEYPKAKSKLTYNTQLSYVLYSSKLPGIQVALFQTPVTYSTLYFNETTTNPPFHLQRLHTSSHISTSYH